MAACFVALRPILYCGGLEGLEIIRLSWCHQNAYGSGHHTGVFVFTDSVHAPPKKMSKNMIVAAHRKIWKRANIKMHLSLHTMFGWCGQIARHTTKFVIPLGGCKMQIVKILATSTYIPHFFVFSISYAWIHPRVRAGRIRILQIGPKVLEKIWTHV